MFLINFNDARQDIKRTIQTINSKRTIYKKKNHIKFLELYIFVSYSHIKK